MVLDVPYELEGLAPERQRSRRRSRSIGDCNGSTLNKMETPPSNSKRRARTRTSVAPSSSRPKSPKDTPRHGTHGTHGTHTGHQGPRRRSRGHARHSLGLWPPFPTHTDTLMELQAETGDDFSVVPVISMEEALPEDWNPAEKTSGDAETTTHDAYGRAYHVERGGGSSEALQELLSCRWETAWCVWFMYIFAGFFHFQRLQVDDFEKQLVDGDSLTMFGIFVKTLHTHLGRRDVVLSNWENHLAQYFRDQGVSFNPFLTGRRYAELNVIERVLVVHGLFTHVMENNSELHGYINAEMNPDAMRIEKFGEDTHGNCYYFFEDTRLYCETAGGHWATVCRTADDWQTMAAKFKGASKHQARDQDLYHSLTCERVEKIIEKLTAKEREQERQRLYDLAPKKRSSRIGQLEAKKKEEERQEILRREQKKLDEIEYERHQKADRQRREREERIRLEQKMKENDLLAAEEGRKQRSADRHRRALQLQEHKSSKMRLSMRQKAQKKRADHERLMRSLGREAGLSVDGFQRQYVFDSRLANVAAKAVDDGVCKTLIEFVFAEDTGDPQEPL